MRVVHLDGPLAMEVFDPAALAQVETDHILQRAGNKEILLFESQQLALNALVVRIQDLRDVFGKNFFGYRTLIIAGVEPVEMKGFSRFRSPQPEIARCPATIAKHRGIVGDAVDDDIRNTKYLPSGPVATSVWPPKPTFTAD